MLEGYRQCGVQEISCNRRGPYRNETRHTLMNQGMGAIYLMRHMRGDRLEEIAREFRVTTHSSVSSVIERTKAIIVKDRVLRHRVEELKEEIYMSQEQT
jgi:hypothetical protein